MQAPLVYAAKFDKQRLLGWGVQCRRAAGSQAETFTYPRAGGCRGALPGLTAAPRLLRGPRT